MIFNIIKQIFRKRKLKNYIKSNQHILSTQLNIYCVYADFILDNICIISSQETKGNLVMCFYVSLQNFKDETKGRS